MQLAGVVRQNLPLLKTLARGGVNVVKGMRRRTQARRAARRSRWMPRNNPSTQIMSAAPVTTATTSRNTGTTVKYEMSTEVLLDKVTSSGTNTAFSVVPVLINPTEPNYFPRLSSLISQYQCYKITSLKFEYWPLQSTSQEGQIFMAFVSDPQAVSPPTSAVLTSLVPSVSSNAWLNSTLVVRPEQMNIAYAENTVSLDKDIGEADLHDPRKSAGTFFVGSEGINTPHVNLGKIKVTYAIRLTKPTCKPEGNQVSGVLQFSPSTADLDSADIDATSGLQPVYQDSSDDRTGWPEHDWTLRSTLPHMILLKWAGVSLSPTVYASTAPGDENEVVVSPQHLYSGVTEGVAFYHLSVYQRKFRVQFDATPTLVRMYVLPARQLELTV